MTSKRQAYLERQRKVAERAGTSDGHPVVSGAQDKATDTHAPSRRWVKGMRSPNPKGRFPNPTNIGEVRELAREKTGAMIEFLSRTALNPKVSITARVQCAIEVVNRAWGRPQQTVDLNHGVQSDLAALLEEIDNRGRLKTVGPPIIEHDDDKQES